MRTNESRKRSVAHDTLPDASALIAANSDHDPEKGKSSGPTSDDELPLVSESGRNEAQILNRVYLGLLPFLCPMALFTYLDRSALSFAAPALVTQLNLSSQQYAIGAGLVFIGYVIFNIPSSLVTHRVGAPLWLGFLLVAWGAVCACTSLVRTQTQFYALRFLLGVAESGCFPGAWYHLSCFLSDVEMAFAYACVLASAALAQVIGGPLAATLLRLEGRAGLHGWQWLFLVEGCATCIYGVIFALMLPRSPRSAWCLSPPDRVWLQRRQDNEKARLEKRGPVAGSAWGALTSWKPYYIGFCMFLVQCGNIAILYFMPLMLKSALYGEAIIQHKEPAAGLAKVAEGAIPKSEDISGKSEADKDSYVALISTALFSATVISQVAVGWSSKKYRERRWHMTIPLVIGGLAFMLTQLTFARAGFVVGYCVLIVAAAGVVAYNGPVGALPAVFLHGQARAAGIAIINSITALGGFVGPYLLGSLNGQGNYNVPMMVLGIFVLLAALLLGIFPDKPTQATESEAAAIAAH